MFPCMTLVRGGSRPIWVLVTEWAILSLRNRALVNTHSHVTYITCSQLFPANSRVSTSYRNCVKCFYH
ncbi:hypothetical protein M408DRAFT_138633 [Serendipita vermifera MAFF 305830]|uniref:Uncharacterized protein n=1 Tax=Serendipita vermifera MAFF 305830 TaxID=933852 RepID=A0A0C3AM50_SERVB|nr:hypothetical protein M408DRAFT_138633 [Serendipita vermifera MAFF 305830]